MSGDVVVVVVVVVVECRNDEQDGFESRGTKEPRLRLRSTRLRFFLITPDSLPWPLAPCYLSLLSMPLALSCVVGLTPFDGSFHTVKAAMHRRPANGADTSRGDRTTPAQFIIFQLC